MSKHANRQLFQRTLSGCLAAAGILAVVFMTTHGQYNGWLQMIFGLFAAGGSLLFGYFALRGRLPGKHLQKASAAISHAADGHDV